MLACGICFDEISNDTIVFFHINNQKSQSKFCYNCIQYMLEDLFNKYINDIADADCEKSLFNALSEPIPLNLTIDTMKKSKQIDLIEYSSNLISAKLQKKITDLELDELNKDIKLLLPKLSDKLFDYISAIKEILTKYKLNDITKN
jgi:hypothetical protein